MDSKVSKSYVFNCLLSLLTPDKLGIFLDKQTELKLFPANALRAYHEARGGGATVLESLSIDNSLTKWRETNEPAYVGLAVQALPKETKEIRGELFEAVRATANEDVSRRQRVASKVRKNNAFHLIAIL